APAPAAGETSGYCYRRSRRPRDVRRDVHRRRRQAHIGKVLRDEPGADVLAPAAADRQGAPVELLVEAHLRTEIGRSEVGVDGVVLDHRRAGGVVDARVEAGTRRKTLLMLPAETDRAARDVELCVALEREAAVDEVVEPAVACLSLEREVAVGIPVGRYQK